MKLLNLQEFLQMPSGTIYTKYHPDIFDDIHIKDDSIHAANDFYTLPLVAISIDDFDSDHSAAIDSFVSTKQCKLDFEFCGRDGLFEDDQLFAVFEPSELREMIKLFQKGLEVLGGKQ